jgi:ketosteroid isomerase-like protein
MTSNIEENKALVRRFFDAIESGDLTIFDQIISQDYGDHLAGQSPGRENIKESFGPCPGKTLGSRMD